jgi:flavodoxin I
MKKIGIFYGPVGGSTERIAKQIQKEIGSDNADLMLIKDSKSSDIDKYENVIFGCSTIGGETWGASKSKPDWDIFRPEFDKINYSGKVFALFGLGDHMSYPRNFVDNMGNIGNIILSKKAKLIGHSNTSDYEFTDSEAVVDGKFIGLPIDEEFESEKSEARIKKWVDGLRRDFK